MHFCLSVKQCKVAKFAYEYLLHRNVSWLTTLDMFSMHIREPMFQISAHFEFVWLGFESIKVGQLLFSYIYTLHRILGSLVWRAITLTQLTWILKFLLCCILDVKESLCFKFHLMMNPIDQFSNMISNGISNFYWCLNLQIY